MASNAAHIKWFRDSSPYIDAHRGRTFVVCLTAGALESPNLGNVLSDFALLNSLGVRLIVVYCGEGRVNAALGDAGLTRNMGKTRPITTAEQISVVSGTLGVINHDLSARFSASYPDAPAARNGAPRRDLSVATGNFVKAMPVGVLEGLDHQLTGDIRAVDADAILHQLRGNAIVLIPPLGYSPSGETFSLDADSLAREVACTTGADKLIYLIQDEGLRNSEGDLLNEIDLSRRDSTELNDPPAAELLSHCHKACAAGVNRCHVVSFNSDGALLEELFTRDGCGTQIVGHSYEQIRGATIEDVPGILRLIEPLEASGVLVKRSRELLESEIDQFVVIERDGLLISCAALYEFEHSGELACLVTHPDYRNSDRGDRLLSHIEAEAVRRNLDLLFVLTTQSAHWFQEHEFKTCSPEELPVARKQFYNYQRNSVVLAKSLK